MNVLWGILESACLSVCQCVSVHVFVCVQLLVSLCRKLLQFCLDCFENLYKYWSHTEVVQEVIMKCRIVSP